MDGNETAGGATPPGRRRIASIGLVAGGLALGAILAGTSIAGAQSATSTATPSATAPAAAGHADPADLDHGPGETLLSGGTADDVSAAALEAVPGGTIIRVETDSDGSAYEAHVRTSDGSIVTVKVDEDLNVTSTESGFAGGMPGRAPSDAAGA